MAYSSYVSDINSKNENLGESENSISKIDFDSLWEGSAHDKQKSNIDALCGEITTQAGYLTSFSSALTSIDEYDGAKEAYDSASNSRSALDSKDEDYSTNYKYYTDIMDEKSKLMKELETKINGLLDGISSSYTTTYTSIPVTEMKSTADILKGLGDVSNTFSGGFDLSNTVVKTSPTSYDYVYDGPRLTQRMGVNRNGPTGVESWYNMDMEQNILPLLRKAGYTGEGKFGLNEFRAKTLDGLVMCAANLNTYKKGDIVKTSLGLGIVCDTGPAFYNGTWKDPHHLELATAWGEVYRG